MVADEDNFDDVFLNDSDTPCRDDRLVFVMSYLNYGEDETGTAEEEPLTLVATLDTATGELDSAPWVEEDEKSLVVDFEYIAAAQYDASSLSESGELLWIGGDGVVYRTEPGSGATTVLNDELAGSADDEEKSYHFFCDRR